MRLSTKGRYGLRAMIELTSSQQEGPIAIHTIAERQDLSERYLEQLLNLLKQAGLVKSIRGAQGGYMLGRDPTTITAGDIIQVLEGPIGPECINEINPGDCKRAEICVAKNLWAEMRDAITAVLDSYTLADLAHESCRQLQAGNYKDDARS